MPGFLMVASTPTFCPHAGQGKPMLVNARVKVMGQPIVLQSTPYAVAGCTLPPLAGGPDVTALWVTGALRVRSSGIPLLLVDGRAQCVPTGSPLTVVPSQARVKGS